MNCPIDGSALSISSREGIEIDFCPQCRGVWLDRGELDKVIERAATSLAPTPVGSGPSQEPRFEREPRYDKDRYDDRRHERRGYDERGYDDRRYGKRKKRGSFLDDIFDFD